MARTIIIRTAPILAAIAAIALAARPLADCAVMVTGD